MPVDKFGRISDIKTKDTGVSLTYINKNYIRSDGSTPVSGSINMNGNTLYNVPDPVNPQDVATKEYADNLNTIAIPIRFTANLIKKKYHFTFGGNVYYTLGLGFLVPHKGYIKKIQQKITGFTESVSGRNVLFNYIFTIIIIRGEEVIELARYSCRSSEYRNIFFYLKRCGTELDLENIPILEGDIIEFKSEIDKIVDPRIDDEILDSLKYINIFFTFLIRLDPL